MSTRHKHLALILSMCLVAMASAPLSAHADVFKKMKKKARQAASSVSAAGSAVQDASEKTAHRVGEVAHDKGTTIGKQIKSAAGSTTHELIENGKVVGHVVIQSGRIVGHEIVENGKVVASETESDGKYIVKQGKIVGREVVVDGKLVGEEIIKDGKVVGHNVVAGGEYVIKAGEIVFDGFSNQWCKTMMSAVKAGLKVKIPAVPGLPGLPDFDDMLADMTKASARQMKGLTGGKKGQMLDQVAKTMKQNANAIPELKQIVAVANKKRKEVADLFSPNVFCELSDEAFDKKLTELDLMPAGLKKKLGFFDGGFFIKDAAAASGKHFYYAYNQSNALAGVAGGVLTTSIITDFRGHGGRYVTLGPQLVSNIGVSAGFGPTYFPSVSAGDLEGWGWSVGISGGPPSKIVSGAVEVAMDQNFKKFQGFGTSGSIGLGVIPGDVAVSNTYTWKLKAERGSLYRKIGK